MKQLNTTLFAVILVFTSVLPAMAQISFEANALPPADEITSPWNAVAADLDGDGDIDIISIGDQLTWSENDGTQNYTNHTISTAIGRGINVAVIDLDEDGDLDVISGAWDSPQISWHENDGNQNFTDHVLTTNRGARFDVIDMDSDNDLDILLPGATLGEFVIRDSVFWLENDGNESFTEQVIYIDIEDPDALFTDDLQGHDLDQDGDMDLLVQYSGDYWDYPGPLYWYENDGNENFTPRLLLGIYYLEPSAGVDVVDLDGDGDLDLIASEDCYCGGDSHRGSISWFENDGDENFTRYRIPTIYGWDGGDVTPADMDGDGDIDLVSGRQFAWFENDGAENFTERSIQDPVVSISSAFIADLDADGHQDILSTKRATDEIVWFKNVPDGSLPVELTSFTALHQQNALTLRWETASESNNASFEVQQRIENTFRAVGMVDAKGNLESGASYTFKLDGLPAGEYTFRLKQIDLDGRYTYSQVLTLSVGLATSFKLSDAYPNPFNPTTQFGLAVAETQHVTVEVLNTLGQRVALLHNGVLSAGETHQFTFEATNLPSGLYLYRATGIRFSAIRKVMLLK